MNNKGMTLGIEILIIVFFAFAAFLSIFILVRSFTGSYDNNYKTPAYYHSIELKLEKAARKYMDGKSINEKTIITTDELKEEKLFNNKCNGYVIIDKTFYTPYIKCDDYETIGYSKVLAN